MIYHQNIGRIRGLFACTKFDGNNFFLICFIANAIVKIGW
uniref:Uncharacterized protein n=1 Tax=Arundo donax TaxID=35708 RepID=A0A0A9AKM9_ARUDO